MRVLASGLRVCKWVMVLVGVLAMVSAARGQILHADGPRPAFEVASVRPSPPGAAMGARWQRQADEYAMKGATVQELVMYAYGVGNENEISGAVGWARTVRFDVEGKVSDAEAAVLSKLGRDDWDEQMRLRMQALLAERFKLVVSFPKKELPVYVLTVAKGGLKCKAAAPTRLAIDLGAAPPRYPETVPPPPPPPPPGADGPQPGRGAISMNPRGWPFWFLVKLLSAAPEAGGRIVVDKTGISGTYDCDLSWVPNGVDAPGPTFFTALQEQLGVKMEPSRAIVETVMVESVERPSEN